MTDAILNITDGTTTISLINESSGFHLVNWIPAITDYKGGGVFQDPPLADWRQLRVAKWATAVENFGLTINGQNPDNAAYNLQELRRLLEKANAYWTTDWQNTPVYIEAKAKCETNTRYCLVVKGRLGNDQNYYRQPFTGNRTTMRDLPLVIERREWLQNIPGTGTAIAISAVEDYNGDSYGNVDSTGTREPVTTDAVYVSNHRVDANITNIHIGTSATNHFGDAVPYSIFSAGLNPTSYFGIDTSLSNSGPFSSIVFDIGNANGDAITGTWEYWNGAVWTSLSGLASQVRDETNSFQNTGINSVSWDQPDNWATNMPAAGFPTGYWVRFVFSGTLTSDVTQQNRQPYSVVWPYVEIQSSVVGGDIPALVKALVQNRSDITGAAKLGRIERFIVGLRSMDRGSNFTPIINAADEQNPSGITITPDGMSFVNDSESPTGRAVQTALSTTRGWIITIDETLASEYLGKYHVYVITKEGATLPAGTTFYIQYRIGTGGTLVTLPSNPKPDPTTGYPFAVDYGELNLLPTEFENPDEITINLYAVLPSATNFTQYYAYFMPIDEFAADFYAPGTYNALGFLGGDSIGNLDSIGVRKGRNSPSFIIKDSLNDVTRGLSAISNGPFILQSGIRQRLYFLMLRSNTTNGKLSIFTELISTIQLQVNQRYLSLRGER